MKETKKRYPIRIILSAVSEVFDVSEKDIFKKTRRKEIAETRQVFAYYLRLLNKMSFSSIARLLRGMDHTTVMYSFKRVISKMEHDSNFYVTMERVFDRIYNIETKIKIENQIIPSKIPKGRIKLKETENIKKESENRIFIKDFIISNREKDIMEKYRRGITLQRISDYFGITRERVRQIVFKVNLKEIGAKTKDGFEIDIDEYIRAEKIAHEQAKRGELEPEEETNKEGKKRWSRFYIKCRSCGTIKIPHIRKGYCEKCIGIKSHETRQAVLTNSSLCGSCKMDRGEAIRKFGRDLYITRDKKILCRGCFMQFTGRKMIESRRRRKSL